MVYRHPQVAQQIQAGMSHFNGNPAIDMPQLPLGGASAYGGTKGARDAKRDCRAPTWQDRLDHN